MRKHLALKIGNARPLGAAMGTQNSWSAKPILTKPGVIPHISEGEFKALSMIEPVPGFDRQQRVTVIIHSLWSKHLPKRKTIMYSVQVPTGATTIDTLETAFSLTNQSHRPRSREFCSTSPGDVVQLDGQYYLVENAGFHALTQTEADVVLQLDCRDTCWGYDRLVSKHLLSPKTQSKPQT